MGKEQKKRLQTWWGQILRPLLAILAGLRVNVGCGPAEERVLLTGLHAVADIYCENCKTTLGWKYEHAFESSQKYKEGKYIIELAHMIKDNGWD
ncbi:Protein yippee-like 2 [Myotis davidii]|uniref:Protein yippee-like n=1 Tax=Myotis davidii TaxID=225400 RepID=L5LH83_MYODS|nr:Protein yippee-like 2 [Myotis davidii]